MYRIPDHFKTGISVHLANSVQHLSYLILGSDPEAYGNLNAPKAVTYSAVIYCLRCLIGYDVPLNQGCLNPVEIKLKRGTILFPSDDAAVVGGNVLTSQRVVDVVFKVIHACYRMVPHLYCSEPKIGSKFFRNYWKKDAKNLT